MQSPQPNSRRVPELDLLRFIAASAVVAYHFADLPGVAAGQSVNPIGPLKVVAQYGYLGVNLFFMISGFVILWTARGRTPLQFVTSRFLRLYPSFWITLLLTIACIAALAPRSDLPNFTAVAANMTMLPGYLRVEFIDGVYWTLAVELKFYFLVLLVIAARQLQRVEGLLVAWLVALTVCQFSAAPGWFTAIMLFPYGSLFAGGGILSIVYSSGWTPLRAVSLLWASVLACIAAAPQTQTFMPHATGTMVATAVVLQACCFLVMALIASRRLAIQRVALAASLGALTYPLYLLHNTFGKIVFMAIERHVPPLIGAVLVIAVVVALCWLIVVVVERRGVGWLSRTTWVRRLMAVGT